MASLDANVKTLSDRDLTELIWALDDRIQEVRRELESREAARKHVSTGENHGDLSRGA